jgi:hypothetical protein
MRESNTETELSVASDIESPPYVHVDGVPLDEPLPISEKECEDIRDGLIAWTLFAISIVVSVCDLTFAYTDHSCSLGPKVSIDIHMEDYLRMNGCMGIYICTFWVIKRYMHHYCNIWDSNAWIGVWLVLHLADLFCKAFLIIFYVFGISLFWSEVYLNTSCTPRITFYTAITVHFKIIMVSVFYRQEQPSVIDIDD